MWSTSCGQVESQYKDAFIQGRYVYDVTVSASLYDDNDRNVTIQPLDPSAMPMVIVGKPSRPHEPNRLKATLESLPVVGPMLMPSPSPPPIFEAGALVACPRSLRLRLLAHNGTIPITRRLTSSVVVSLVDTDAAPGTAPGTASPRYEGLELRVAGIMLEGALADDVDVEEEIEVEVQEEEEVPGLVPESEFPIEEIISILSSLAVAAAGSEFVRKYVKPQEYAMQKAKEAESKKAQLEKNRADQALRAILATPVEEVEIEAAKLAIDEAHEANVMNSLIEKTFEHLQLAVIVQLMGPHI